MKMYYSNREKSSLYSEIGYRKISFQDPNFHFMVVHMQKTGKYPFLEEKKENKTFNIANLERRLRSEKSLPKRQY